MSSTETETHTERPESRKPARADAIRIWTFFAASVLVSWTIWLWPVEEHGSIYIVVLWWRFDFPLPLTKLMIGICAPGVLALAWSLFESRDQFHSMVKSVCRWRAPFRWYLLALVLPWVLFWVSLGLVLLYFPSSLPRPSPERFLLNILLLLPFGPLWEEIAWRAFALRKLEQRYSLLASSLILGGFWAAWHVPFWFTYLQLTRATAGPVLILGMVSVVAWSVVFAFAYERTSQSLPVVIILHAAYDSAASVIFPTLQAGQLSYVSTTSALAVCLGLVLAVRMRGAATRAQG